MKRMGQWLGEEKEFALLWVGGLGLLQIYILRWLLPLSGEPYEWAQFLLLGTAFPVLVLLVSFARATSPRVRAFSPLLVLACLLAAPLLFVPGWDFGACIAVGQLLLLTVLFRFAERRKAAGGELRGRFAQLLVPAALVGIIWPVAVRLVWWAPFPGWMFVSPYSLAVFLGCLLLTSMTVARLCCAPDDRPGRLQWVGNAVAFLIFALTSTHVYASGMRGPSVSFQGGVAFHHWGAIVGPAELIQQGGWPLWDVPAQYGFLNTVFLAWLPFANVWQSLYALNAALLCLSACIVFWLFRTLRPGLIHYGFSVLLTLGCVFLLPGWPVELTGPFTFPSVGAYRFLWCYVLLAVLFWDYRATPEGTPGHRSVLWAGCLAWLAGVLWSPESAVWCTTIWLPAYTLLLLRRATFGRAAGESGRMQLPRLFAWLALPAALVTTGVGGISTIYVIGLGHLPDWSCFIEYPRAASFFALPINPQGSVGVLLIVYLAIVATGATCLSGPAPLRHLPLVVGAAATLWAVSSYFVGRSHDANVTNLSPLIAASIGVTLHVLDRISPAAWPSLVKIILMPILTVMLAAGYWNQPALEQYVRDTAVGYREDVTLLLPEADSDLQNLLWQAGAEADALIVFLDDPFLHDPQGLPTPCPRWYPADREEGSRPLATTRVWLPLTSMTVYGPLSPERRAVYFSRFVARTRRSGWLIRPNADPSTELSWFLDQVRRTHLPGRSLSNDRWQMTWFEWNPAP